MEVLLFLMLYIYSRGIAVKGGTLIFIAPPPKALVYVRHYVDNYISII